MKKAKWFLILWCLGCCWSYGQAKIPVEIQGGGQSHWSWLTANHYRVVMQCRSASGEGGHNIAWAEVDFEGIARQLNVSADVWNPDSVRVIEYDRETGEAVRQNSGDGLEAYLVPAKLDEWHRYQQQRNIERKRHLSWLRREGDGAGAVYICYFDFYGRGETERIAKPAFVGTGDSLSFGKLGEKVDMRGVPLVCDWDGDGDNDIITSLMTVPERGSFVYLSEGSDIKQIFGKRRMVSANLGVSAKQVVDVDNDGRLDAVKKGGYYSDFINQRFSKWVSIDLPLEGEIGKGIKESRTVNWFVADWDADGLNDVIVGAGWWKEYGWSNAFDENGKWINGPLRGWFYVFRNLGNNRQFKSAEPFKVMTTAGLPAEVYGYPSPQVVDIDSDGDLDILSGNFLDRIKVFVNVGSRGEPKFAPPVDLLTTEGEFECYYQALTLHAVDWDGDGDLDIFFRCENDGLGYLENTGRSAGEGRMIFKPAVYPDSEGDYPNSAQLVTNNLSDWDNDGDLDLIFGNSPGQVGWYECLSGYPLLRFRGASYFKSAGEDIRIAAGYNGSIQGPAEAKWGYTVPWAADWDGDGYKDIMLNSIWGKILWYRNPGDNGSLNLDAAEAVRVRWAGDSPKPEWRWWKPGEDEWSTQWRSTVQMLDYNHDGLLDVAALDYEGYLVLHRRVMDGGEKVLLPGQRIFRGGDGKAWQINPLPPGGCGRRKFELCDWDNDGDWDLVVDDKQFGWKVAGSVAVYENVVDDAAPLFLKQGAITDIMVAGHTCCPSVFDVDGDGRLDLLMGAEDGHFYCFHRSYIEDKYGLEAGLVECDTVYYSDSSVVLFDETAVGDVKGGEIVSGKGIEGGSCIFAVNDDDGFYAVTLDIGESIDIMDNRVLEMRVNCGVDDLHQAARLRWVTVVTLPNDDNMGQAIYYPDNNHGVPAASYTLDGESQAGGSVVFDDDVRTWQVLRLDMASGLGLPVCKGVRASSVVRRIMLTFKGSAQVYVDDMKVVCKR